MIENPKIGDKVWALIGSKIIEFLVEGVGRSCFGTTTISFDEHRCMHSFSNSDIYPSLESLIEHLRETAIHLPEEKANV